MKIWLDESLYWLVLIVAVAAMFAAGGLMVFGGERPAAACPALESPQHEALNRLAQAHAEFMARVQVQGHQGFDARFHAAREATNCRAVAEICAESWPWQRNETPAAIWAEYARCWRQSPGHWAVAGVRHRYVGAGTAMGKNGVHYGCIIAAD